MTDKRTALEWINDVLSSRDMVAGKSFYKVTGREIKATDGKLIAGHPWPDDFEFVVPGEEFEKVFARMKAEPIITKKSDKEITIRSGRFNGTIGTLSLDHWSYPGIEGVQWRSIPKKLHDILKALRPFVSDNAMQKWATCIALENGWAYVTNNVALAGAECKELGAVMALLPSWAADFVIPRLKGLTDWAWTDNYVAFLWSNGAWMRSNLVVGQFPEKAAALIRQVKKEKTTQKITDEFRDAFIEIAELSEDTVMIYKNKIVAKYKQAEVVAEDKDFKFKVPQDNDCSIWGASFLIPAIKAANSWSPDVWPKPAPFHGDVVSGYVIGRKA